MIHQPPTATHILYILGMIPNYLVKEAMWKQLSKAVGPLECKSHHLIAWNFPNIFVCAKPSIFHLLKYFFLSEYPSIFLWGADIFLGKD